MKHMRTFLGAGLLAVPLMVASQGEAALSVGGLIQSGVPNTLLSDNSAEFLINVDGSTALNPNTGVLSPTVTTGDILFAVLGINTIEPGGSGSTTIGSGTAYNEITAVVASKIATAADIDLGPTGSDDSFGGQAIDLFQFTSVPLSAGDATYFDWSTGLIDLDGVGTGADTLGVDQFTFTTGGGVANDDLQIALVFEDGLQDYDRDSTLPTGLTSASNGTLRLVGELNPANVDFFSVIAPTYILDFGSVPASTAIDNTNIALDFTLVQQFGWNLGPDITGGNGGFSSPSAGSGWPIFDNLDFTVTPLSVIPEPGTIILMGLGLVGLAGIARKRMTA